jgi:uracil phosphoribosyltransferase
MIVPHREHPNLRLFEHPLVAHKLTRVRDRSTSSAEFRRLLNEIAGLMTFGISADLPTEEVALETPMEATRGVRIRGPVTLVPILRAGLGMTDGILALFPEARVGHVGLYRDETDLVPVPYYLKLPADVAQGPVLIVDPMLATGGSAAHAAGQLKARGCRTLSFVCLVCAPPGVERMRARHPDVPIYAAALDRQLDARGFILPGLGDAGDRIFGTT